MRTASIGLLVLTAFTSFNRASAAGCPAQTTETLRIRGSSLCLLIDEPTPPRRQLLHTWVERSARIVTSYYGRFPAPLVILRLRSTAGDRIGGGRTTNESGLLIQVSVGRETTAAVLSDDWVLVHEMVHLALPEVGREHNWLAEGLAVYVEGVARAQFGDRDVADVWAEDRHSMPMGLPRAGEGGMDQTPSWGRTYWGGALYCLQADVAIRERTGNRVGLQTALRAILEKTGGYGFESDIRERFAHWGHCDRHPSTRGSLRPNEEHAMDAGSRCALESTGCAAGPENPAVRRSGAARANSHRHHRAESRITARNRTQRLDAPALNVAGRVRSSGDRARMGGCP